MRSDVQHGECHETSASLDNILSDSSDGRICKIIKSEVSSSCGMQKYYREIVQSYSSECLRHGLHVCGLILQNCLFLAPKKDVTFIFRNYLPGWNISYVGNYSGSMVGIQGMHCYFSVWILESE